MEFKTKKAWEAFVDKGISEGKTPQQMNKLAGTYDGPEGRFTVHQKARSNRGWEPVNLAVRAKRGKKRTGKGKEQDAEFLKTLKAAGLSDEEAKAILQEEKRGYTRTKNLAKRYTDESTTGSTFNAGHETGSGKGGGDLGSNVRVERGKSIRDEDGNIIKRGNQSRGLNDEFADPVKPAMGVPRSGRGGRDTALKHLLIRDNPKIMDLGLTPKDRQAIRANPSQANEIILARQEQIAAIEEVKTSGKPISAAGKKFGLNIRSIDPLQSFWREVKQNPLGSAMGGIYSLAIDPMYREALQAKDPLQAGLILGTDIAAGAVAEGAGKFGLNIASRIAPTTTANTLSALSPALQAVSKVAGPVMLAYQVGGSQDIRKLKSATPESIQRYERETGRSATSDETAVAGLSEEESRQYLSGGGNTAMTKYGWTMEQTMQQGRKNLELQRLENMKEYK